MLPSTRSCVSPRAPDALVVPAHFDGERRAVHAGERARVERGGDVADVAGLENFLLDRRRRAAAARTHADQLDVLLVNVLGGEAIDGIGAAGDGAEVVLLFGEHFRDPGLGERALGNERRHDSHNQQRAKRLRIGTRLPLHRQLGDFIDWRRSTPIDPRLTHVLNYRTIRRERAMPVVKIRPSARAAGHKTVTGGEVAFIGRRGIA